MDRLVLGTSGKTAGALLTKEHLAQRRGKPQTNFHHEHDGIKRNKANTHGRGMLGKGIKTGTLIRSFKTSSSSWWNFLFGQVMSISRV